MPAHDKNSQTIKPQNQFSKGNTAFQQIVLEPVELRGQTGNQTTKQKNLNDTLNLIQELLFRILI